MSRGRIAQRDACAIIYLSTKTTYFSPCGFFLARIVLWREECVWAVGHVQAGLRPAPDPPVTAPPAEGPPVAAQPSGLPAAAPGAGTRSRSACGRAGWSSGSGSSAGASSFVAWHGSKAHLFRAASASSHRRPLNVPAFRLKMGALSCRGLNVGSLARRYNGESYGSAGQSGHNMDVADQAKLCNVWSHPAFRDWPAAAPLSRPRPRRTHVRMSAIVIVPADQVHAPLALSHVIDMIPIVVSEKRIIPYLADEL